MPQSTIARREAGRRPPSGLPELISPVTVAEFREEYWGKRHLVIHREDSGYFDGLLTLGDMDHLIATSKIRSSDLRVVTNGKEAAVSEFISINGDNYANAVEVLYDQYRNGATINLLYLHEQWQPLARLCQALAVELSSLPHVNVYLTPPDAQGLQEHYDTHDVFVGQVHGRKLWRLYKSPLPLPLRTQGYSVSQEGPGEPTDEFELAEGDLVYLPRGTVHQAVSFTEQGSLHFTVGVQPVLWARLISKAVERTLESDIRFRRALPFGFTSDAAARQEAERHAAELLDVLHERVKPERLISDAMRQAFLARKPSLEGHLTDLESIPALNLDTKIRRRQDILCQVREDRANDTVVLEFHGKQLIFPAAVADELHYLSQAGRFAGREIPGSLDEAGRLVLIQTLLRQGFLTHA